MGLVEEIMTGVFFARDTAMQQAQRSGDERTAELANMLHDINYDENLTVEQLFDELQTVCRNVSERAVTDEQYMLVESLRDLVAYTAKLQEEAYCVEVTETVTV